MHTHIHTWLSISSASHVATFDTLMHSRIVSIVLTNCMYVEKKNCDEDFNCTKLI